ncbi:hypothetical protein BV20DRAFT_1122001 [Pilatotrama ljubarskyi]|nr:hypothetical protein BV20DRAFT_1122001 [Pilatotrama ljubarskyi]
MASLDRVYAALKEVEAPVSDRDALERLYKGRMADVLDFVATNIKGRRASAAARDEIQTYREEARGHSLGSYEDVDPLYARIRRADVRLKHARIALEKSEEARQKHSCKVLELEAEADALQDDLQDKRLTMLLLSVLERKESIRKERFKVILKLLEQLRERAKELTTAQSEAAFGLSRPRTPIHPVRVEYTRDTLASLQAHSLRLSRLSSLAQDSTLAARTGDAETCLRDAVARSMGLSADHPDVVSVHERCVATAKSRACLSVQYRSPLPEGEPPEDLEDLSDRIAERERELQDLADRAAALTLASARALQAVRAVLFFPSPPCLDFNAPQDAAFREETVPQLKDSLQTEAAAARGYVDALRLSIMNRPRAADGARGSRDKDLSGGRSFAKTLDDIERTFDEMRDTDSFLVAADALISPDSASIQRHMELAASYVEEDAEVSRRVQKLLERKAAKADAGRALVEDIERIIAEVGIIAGTHV